MVAGGKSGLLETNLMLKRRSHKVSNY
jgi:hypothetical protein